MTDIAQEVDTSMAATVADSTTAPVAVPAAATPGSATEASASSPLSSSDPAADTGAVVVVKPRVIARAKAVPRSQRAELQIPVALVEKRMRASVGSTVHVSSNAVIQMADSVETVAKHCVKLASVLARASGKIRVAPKHFKIALEEDSDLKQLVGPSFVAGAGVAPFIEPYLMQRRKKSNATKQRERRLKKQQEAEAAAAAKAATPKKRKAPASASSSSKKSRPSSSSASASTKKASSSSASSRTSSAKKQKTTASKSAAAGGRKAPSVKKTASVKK